MFGSLALERVMGQGACAIAYLAKDTELGRRLVLREHAPADCCTRRADTGAVLALPGYEASFRESLLAFMEEARLLASLQHPQLAHVYEVFEMGGTAYTVQSYVEGSVLPDWLRCHPENKRRLPEVLKEVLSLLSWLHGQDVFHRDIKPAHLLMDSGGHVHLIDFGAACRGTGHMPLSLTPPYSPPEQNVPSAAGPWSDLYALAASFYTVVSGRQPMESLRRLDDDCVPPLAREAALRSLYPRRFLASIDRALSLLPARRFASAAEWLGYLEPAGWHARRGLWVAAGAFAAGLLAAGFWHMLRPAGVPPAMEDAAPVSPAPPLPVAAGVALSPAEPAAAVSAEQVEFSQSFELKDAPLSSETCPGLWQQVAWEAILLTGCPAGTSGTSYLLLTDEEGHEWLSAPLEAAPWQNERCYRFPGSVRLPSRWQAWLRTEGKAVPVSCQRVMFRTLMAEEEHRARKAAAQPDEPQPAMPQV